MALIEKHTPGSFSWLELGTTDAVAAKAFYSGIFGWEVKDVPAGPMTYTLLQIQGVDVAALYPMGADMAGIPPHWLSYVAVEDCDATTAKAKELGGTVKMGPFDVMDHGRMAVIADPGGAVFALWQPKTHIGLRRTNELNALCWQELYVHDRAAAETFYSKLFGWELKHNEPYCEIHNQGCPIGGMLQIQPEWGPVPPNWLAYLSVANTDEVIAKTKAGGGSLKMGPTDIPVGRFAVLGDPQGAVFAVIQLNGTM
jgi:uncharacterized protein